MTETYDGPFSLLQMFWGSITARPLRSFLSVIAIAIQVILVLMIVGLTSGVISEWGKRVEGVGADILVQPPNSSIFFAFLSVGMQEPLGEKIAALSGVDEVAPTVILTEPKNLVMVYGIDYQRFNALSKGFLFRAGRPFEGPDEVIADDIIAQTRHLKVGSQITLLNHTFTVSGIVAHGKGARYFIPIRTAQEIAGAEKRVSMFYARGFGISLASHIKHGNAPLRPGDFLGRADGNEIAGALPVGNDPADCKRMIQQCDLAANLQVARLRDDVVGDHFVRPLKGAPGAEEESFAQRIESFVINPVDHH